jgi:anthranilate synthase component I
MFFPNEEDYLRLAADHDIVPVYRELLADTETPVSVLQRFADRENAFLLESLEGGEKWGRFSFVGIDPELLLDVDHSVGNRSQLEAIRTVYRDYRVAEIPGLPRFFGGVVGFVGYEGMCEFERMPEPKMAGTAVKPRSRFLKADRLIVFDNIRHTVKIVVCTRPGDAADPVQVYRAAHAEIDAIAATLEQPAPSPHAERFAPCEFVSNMTPEAYRKIVSGAKDYIYAGDIIQVVLSQRFSAETAVPAVQLYRALRLTNPSPYTFFLKVGKQTLVGSSPEIMVRLTGSRIELRPIAGTRHRGATEQEDRRLADELLADEKEKAEHVMLVDLGRNDVGRVAEPGSVQVTEYMVIERYSHVMHMVSHVEGILRKEFDAYDVMKATFPAGTLTGAPKIRAMEIIHELEPEPRGAYGGALGYVSYTGNMDLAITIRTMDVEDGTVSVQAGAGIVFDSDPQREYEETCHKARGMQKAVAMAADGLEVSGE